MFFGLIIHIYLYLKFEKEPPQTRYIIISKYKFLYLKIKSIKFKIIHNIHKQRRRHDGGESGGSNLSLHK